METIEACGRHDSRWRRCDMAFYWSVSSFCTLFMDRLAVVCSVPWFAIFVVRGADSLVWARLRPMPPDARGELHSQIGVASGQHSKWPPGRVLSAMAR